MAYVDGFIIPVPKQNLDKYRELAELSATVWKEYGALEYREWIADDVKPGELTSFPQSVLSKPDETVIFAWIVYESREQRDRVNEQVLKDPRMANAFNQMPFDSQRMIYGGFTTLLER